MRTEGTWPLTGVTLGVKVLKPALEPGLPDSESNAHGLQYPISSSPQPFFSFRVFFFYLKFYFFAYIYMYPFFFKFFPPTRLLQKVEPSSQFP